MNKGILDSARLLIGLAFTLAGVTLAYWKYTKKDIR
jgi:ABC-2 type transport system permease protein